MSSVRDELVKNAEAITWVPENIKEGRFGEWLRNVKDWALSRDRYWGTPLPIWVCDECGRRIVAESAEQLEKLSGERPDDLHKPYIDDIEWMCECKKGIMKRTPEVLDVWFDSGAMPLAQFSYPAGSTDEEKSAVESGKTFPAGFISEAIDQTRGWFYTLHAVATLLHKAGVVPAGNAYNHVICLGHVLDGQGKKMSKSKGNVIDPFQVFDEYGADMLRWALFSVNQPGLPKRFDAKVMRDVQNRVFRMLWNSYSFFMTYASIDKWKPGTIDNRQPTTDNILDRWILSELQLLVQSVDGLLAAYDIYGPTQKIESFIDHLSNWYIRRSRKRFWKSEDDGDKESAYATLHHVLVELSKLMAPFTPFLAEEMYRNLTGFAGHPERSGAELKDPESVHLADYPRVDESLIDEKLNEDMGLLREIISLGLQARAESKFKVRQPLQRVFLPHKYADVFDRLINNLDWSWMLRDELNVKGAELGDYEEVTLDINITPGLKLEGQAREIIRAVQEGRKSAGFNVEDRISLGYRGMDAVFADEALRNLIAGETLAEGGVTEGELAGADHTGSVDLDGEPFTFWLKR
jgi:isoleucyl-tRNA synthetase